MSNRNADAAQSSGGTPANKPRNPVERGIVWGLIAGLLGLVGYEYRQLTAYNKSIHAVGELLKGEDSKYYKLSDLRKAVTGTPSEQDVEFKHRLNRKLELKWHSFFKDYRLELLTEKGDDPLVVSFSTPNAVEPEKLVLTAAVPSAPIGSMGTGIPGGAGGGEPGGGQRNRGLFGMALRDEVAVELKLTDEQKSKLDEAQAQMRDAFGKVRDLPEAERPEAMRKLREDSETTAKGIIDDTQFTRLLQLTWREAGISSVERDDVAKLVDVTDDQREKIKSIMAARQDALRTLGMMAPPDAAAAKRKEFDEQVKAALSEEQLKKFEAALGSPAPQPAPQADAPIGDKPTADKPAEPAKPDAEPAKS